MLYMYVQRLVSFKFQRPQITVVTNHPCYDTVILNPNIETELHGIAVVLLCDELTVWRDAYVTSWPVPSWSCDDMTAWRDDRVTSWLVAGAIALQRVLGQNAPVYVCKQQCASQAQTYA